LATAISSTSATAICSSMSSSALLPFNCSRNGRTPKRKPESTISRAACVVPSVPPAPSRSSVRATSAAACASTCAGVAAGARRATIDE
jgi:hypothetical protein